MKNDKIKQSYRKLNLSDTSKEKILFKILSENSNHADTDDLSVSKKKFYMKKTIIAAVACILLFSVSGTAYAFHKWMSAQETSKTLGMDTLAEEFGKSETEIVYSENDEYRAAFLGEVSGKNLNQNKFELDITKTYLVVAIERTDGGQLHETLSDEGIIVTPFIQGLSPLEFNIYSMGGIATGKVYENTLYYIIECDNLTLFADREVYLAISDDLNHSSALFEGYNYDEKTGLISRNTNYDGLNLLFELNIDSSKADPVAAEKYLKSLQNEPPVNEPQPTHNTSEEVQNMQATPEFNGFNDLEDYGIKSITELEGEITLIPDSELELTPQDGMLHYKTDTISLRTSEKVVKEKGMDSATLYGSDNLTLKFIATWTYENGKYYGRTYKINEDCKIFCED